MDLKVAYDNAFIFLCQYINDYIINEGCVEKMTMLREKYLTYIEEHTPMFYTPMHKTLKLKYRLISHFGDKIQFWHPNYKSELVYSSDLQTSEAVEVTFEGATSETKIH